MHFWISELFHWIFSQPLPQRGCWQWISREKSWKCSKETCGEDIFATGGCQKAANIFFLHWELPNLLHIQSWKGYARDRELPANIFKCGEDFVSNDPTEMDPAMREVVKRLTLAALLEAEDEQQLLENRGSR